MSISVRAVVRNIEKKLAAGSWGAEEPNREPAGVYNQPGRNGKFSQGGIGNAGTSVDSLFSNANTRKQYLNNHRLSSNNTNALFLSRNTQEESNSKTLPTSNELREKLHDIFLYDAMRLRYRMLSSAINGEPFTGIPTRTFSALSNPDLFGMAIREEFLREGTIMGDSMAREFLSAMRPTEGLWDTLRYQGQIMQSYQDMYDFVDRRLAQFQGICRYHPAVKQQYKIWMTQRKMMRLASSVVEKDVLCLNVHPNSNAPYKVKGIYMRISGPRRATRAIALHDCVGSHGIKGGNRIYSDGKTDILTKNMGVFGLRFRVIYGDKKDMILQENTALTAEFGATPFQPALGKSLRISNTSTYHYPKKPIIKYYNDSP